MSDEKRASVTIDPEKVLYTWPDGGLAYDCRGCGACCKGLGIGVDGVAGQMASLCVEKPGAAAFARLRGATWTVFNPRDRCWFLDDEGLCRVELESGRAAKPASCRLFPFNRVFRLGSWTVIDLNTVICPLELVSEQGKSAPTALGGPVWWDDVLADVRTVLDPAVVGTPLPAEEPEAEGAALVAREREVAAQCFSLAATCQGADGSALERLVEAAFQAQRFDKHEGPRPTIEGLRYGLSAVFGSEALRLPSAETLESGLLATPSLRFNELYGRRAYPGGRTALNAALPVMWRAWIHILAVGEELAERPLSLQEVTTTWSEVAALVYLLGLWQTPVYLTSDAVSLPSGVLRDPVERCARACLASGAAEPFGAHAGPLVSFDTPWERVAALRAFEAVLPNIGLGSRATVSRGPQRRGASRPKRRRRR